MHLTLGEKLKDLRTGKGLTTNQLCSEILNLYGYELSKGKYNEMERDIEKDYGYKAFVYLAKFYGVSVDYLLGLAKEPTTDKDLNFVCEYTGLSKAAIEELVVIKKVTGDDIVEITDSFISDGILWNIVHSFSVLQEESQKYVNIDASFNTIKEDEEYMRFGDSLDTNRYRTLKEIDEYMSKYDARDWRENNAKHNPKKE